MAEHDVDARLRAAARALDARAPAFDAALVEGTRVRRAPTRVVAVVCIVLAGVAVVPAAVSALHGIFDVEEVPALGPLEPGVAPPYAGRAVPLDIARASVAFPVRTIYSLGAPDEARVRDDVTGGMVTVVYRSARLLLTQWPARDVNARIGSSRMWAGRTRSTSEACGQCGSREPRAGPSR